MSRAEKRREWHNSWRNHFLAHSGKINFDRKFRRLLWKESWKAEGSLK
jgi:hypothetical protein